MFKAIRNHPIVRNEIKDGDDVAKVINFFFLVIGFQFGAIVVLVLR